MAKDDTGRLHVTVKAVASASCPHQTLAGTPAQRPLCAQASATACARARAYKLIEIDDKYHFLKQGISVVDSAPRPAAGARSRPSASAGPLARADRRDRSAGNAGGPRRRVCTARLSGRRRAGKLIAMMGTRADVVMSDMAANTTGHRKTDQSA